MFGAGLPVVGAQAVLAGVQQFNAASRQVIGQLNLINKATNDLGEVSVSSFSRASQASGISTGAIIRSTGLITAALVATAAAFKELGAAAGIETTFKTIQGLSNATESEISRLGDTVTQLSDKFGDSMKKLADTSQVLSRAGLSFQDIKNGALEATESLIKASKGELSVEEASIAVAQGLTTFHLAATESTRVVDALANAANGSTASFGDLATSIKYLGTSAAVLHIPIEDAAGAIAVMAQNSVRGSTAGTGLRAMLQALEKPTKDALGEMQKYNISLFDAQGKFVGLRTLILELNKAFGEEALALGKVTEMERANALARIFTTRGAQAAIAIAISGTEAFDKALENNTSAAGIAAKVMESFENQIARVGTALQNTATNALLPMLPVLANVARDFADLVIIFRSDAITSFNSALSGTQAVVQNISSILSPITQGFIGIATSIYDITKASSGVNAFFNGFNGVLGTAITLAGEFELGLATLIEMISKYPRAVDAATIAFTLLGAVLAVDVILAAAFAFGALLTPITALIVPVASLAISFGALGVSMAAAALGGVAVLASAIIGFLPEILGIVAIAAVAVVTYASLELAWRSSRDAIFDFASTIANLTPGIRASIQKVGEDAEVSGQRQAAFANFAIAAWDAAASFIVGAVNKIIGAFKALSGGGVVGQAILAQIPVVGPLLQFVDGLNYVTDTAIPAAKSAVSGFATDLQKTFDAAGKSVLSNIQKAHDEVDKLLADTRAKLNETRNQAALLEQRRGEIGPSSSVRGRGSNDIPELGFPPSSGGGGAAKAVTALDLSKKIQQLLADIPGMTRQLADYLGGIAKDYPERLAPMVEAVRSSKLEISRAVIAKKDLLGTTMAISEVDKNIAKLQAAISKLDIQQKLATIGYERQLLGLRLASLRVAQQMWPLQDRMTEIQRRMRDLQQEDLGLAQQQLSVESEMLFFQIKIEEIDKSIAETNRVNYAAQKQLAVLQQQMLPIQHQIADVDKAITMASKEDYYFNALILGIQARMLPTQQAIAAIDTQISRSNRANLTLARERLVAELAVAEQKQKLLAYEQQIANIVDRRQQLTMRKDQLTTENEIAGLEDQLAALDKSQLDAVGQRNFKTVSDIEKQKEATQGLLDAANEKLTRQQRESEALARNNELQEIGIRLQEQAIIDIITPLDQKIARLNAINDIETIQKQLEQNSLESYKQLLENILNPLQDQLTKLQNIQDISKINQEIILAFLNNQKQGLEALLKPYQDQYDAFQRQIEIQRIANEIAKLGLEAEKQAIIDQMKPLQDKLDAIEREKRAQELRNKAILLQLEAERRSLVAQLEPLEDVRRAIERQTAEIELQKAAAELAFEETKLRYQEQLLKEQERRADLEETRVAQQETYEGLILELLKALNQSQAFTEDEAIEVAKRLKLWDEQVAKIAESTSEMHRLEGAAKMATEALNAIPKNIEVTLTYRYVTIGSPPTGAPGANQPPSGGAPPAAGDPGATPPSNGPSDPNNPAGPGGVETPLSSVASLRTFAASTALARQSVVVQNIRNNTYSVDANYKYVQNPGNIAADLKAMIALTQ